VNLTCPACGAPFSADDVHLDVGIANCRICRGVLDLRASDRPMQRPRPPRFHVEESDGRLSIAWRWFAPANLAMIPLLICWFGFLALFYADALSAPHNITPFLLIPLLHVATGIGLAYPTVANIVNRTRIVVAGDIVTVRHGPLPWWGNRTLVRSTITQLFCRRDTGNKGAISYALVAIDRSGTRIDLVRALQREDDVRWLEDTLERRIGIANKPVVGEVA
jgi:hypothetical protein